MMIWVHGTYHPIIIVPKNSTPGELPRQRMYFNFGNINELQPKIQRVDKKTNTQGNFHSFHYQRLMICTPIYKV